MKLLHTLGRGLAWLGRGLVSLVRDDAYTDIRGTYPEHAKATQEQAATNASVTTSLSGLGHGGL
jgi:lauroyl/myristoyl acyltransferase